MGVFLLSIFQAKVITLMEPTILLMQKIFLALFELF